jgi:hypothetical protein
MADLQALHTQAKRLILTIRAGLERLETAEQVGKACWLLLGCSACCKPQATAAEAESVANNYQCWCLACALMSIWLQNTRAIVPNGLATELQQQLQQLQVSVVAAALVTIVLPALTSAAAACQLPMACACLTDPAAVCSPGAASEQ